MTLHVCARCDAPIEDDAPRIFGDCDPVQVCFECGSGWLAENIAAFGTVSLSVYIGKATAADIRRHAERLEDERAEEARIGVAAAAREREEAERAAAKRERAAAAREARQAATRAARVARAAKVARIVHEHGSVNRLALGPAVGVSSDRTLARILAEARDRGWIVTSLGAKGGVHPGPVPVPDDVALKEAA